MGWQSAAAVLLWMLLKSSLIEHVVFKVVSIFRFSSCVSSGATFALTAASNPLLPARGGHTHTHTAAASGQRVALRSSVLRVHEGVSL